MKSLVVGWGLWQKFDLPNERILSRLRDQNGFPYLRTKLTAHG